MKYLSYAALIGVVVALFFWATTPYAPKEPDANITPTDQFSSEFSSMEESSESSFPSSVTILKENGINTRYYYSSSEPVSIEPIIEEKAYRAPFVPHFPRPSSISSSSASASSSASSSSKPSYCSTSGTGWLSVYTDLASKEAAIRIRSRICR